ncbi:transcriptional regulator MntR [Alicyclobacillus curvatus]|nr:transcriptional regulator MntR [Alicyclobacillus curvatus]
MATTPSKEDYMEAIWTLIQNKGYARTVDLAERLGVNSASVSKMIQRLDEDGLLVYERYKGMVLTADGTKLGQKLSARHQLLERFFEHLGLDIQAEIHETVEGIEHYVNANVLRQIEVLVNYIDQHPDWWKQFTLTDENG